MALGPPESSPLIAAGMQAMRSGDPGAARRFFEQALSKGAADRSVVFALAAACYEAGDLSAAHEALDELLHAEPRSVRAMMMKADCYASQGNGRAAASYYRAVIALVPQVDNLPPEIAAEIERAKVASANYAAEMLSHLNRAVAAAGYDKERSSRRFTDSIEMLAGAKRRYIEEPKSYFFPDLPARNFYEREEFDWVSDFEKATEEIAGELAAVLDKEELFEPYVRAERDRPNLRRHKLLDSLDWGALYIWRNGELTEEARAHFPKTIAALERVPMDRAKGRAPMVLFSRLAPGARIEPHTGLVNTRLICHLPVIVPGKCYLRVGNDCREWKRGELLLFNDTIEHEAWNDSNRQRIILLFSVWRPELSEEEQKLSAAVISSALSFSENEA